MSTARKHVPAPTSPLSPMESLAALGQSIWLDSIDRSLIRSGELERLIAKGLRGLTSNPTIFEKAIGKGHLYDPQIQELLSRRDLEVKDLFDELSIKDIQDAADLFFKVYQESRGQDGMVSLELAPFLAHDAEASIEEAKRLWTRVGRPNLMIKVPGTPEGLIAFENLIADGINVNVTLLFSRQVYRRFAEGYVRAMEIRLQKGLSLERIVSVASFFVSRIDTEIDTRLNKALHGTLDRERRSRLQSLLGRVAIANARLAYGIFHEVFSSERWRKLEEAGAFPQRVLWASTSTKNPEYRDVMYVEQLIGPSTVNTLPPKTLSALEDHAVIKTTLAEGRQEAEETLARLDGLGISLDEVTEKLLTDGIRLFSEPYQELMSTLERARRSFLKPPLNSLELRLPILLETEIGRVLQLWKANDRVRRLWNRDAALWTQTGEEHWLGWLDVLDRQMERLDEFEALQREVSSLRFRDAVVLGMGGSSLCPDVLGSIYEPSDNFPDLHVLDSTHPDQVRALEAKLDLARTLFIVSSKSGSTLEPHLFFEYFYERMVRTLGKEDAGSHFIAITDPGTELEKLARERGFRHVYQGIKSIGGRYSALSDFGLIPATILGMNIPELLKAASEMQHSCGPNVPLSEHPGALLGTFLGTLCALGRNKVTLLCSREIWDLGSWIEQLLAESTGKLGKGLIPVCDEKPGSIDAYGADRQFIYLKLNGTQDRELQARVDALAEADFPVVQIEVSDCRNLVQEFFRWELATAVAGSILELNPFDQPDVEAAKAEAKRLTTQFERSGAFPEEKPFFRQNGISLFADPKNARELLSEAGGDAELGDFLRSHVGRLRPGDYFSILAYLPMNFQVEGPLEEFRIRVRNQEKVATCVGFGPRYLHSTGQAYKGGPNSGVFLMITADANELPIPGRKAGFAVVNAAQARGDFEVLARRGRRLLRIHLEGDVPRQLEMLKEALS